MATLNENVGRATLKHLDYVGGLSIQLWAAVRALGTALPVTMVSTMHATIRCGRDFIMAFPH